MRRNFLALIAAAAASALLAGCMGPQGDTAAQKRAEARKMRSETLAKLYAVEPGARDQIAKAKGYAVFSNVGVNVIFLSAGNGWGIVRDNASGRDTYMKMASGAGGERRSRSDRYGFRWRYPGVRAFRRQGIDRSGWQHCCL